MRTYTPKIGRHVTYCTSTGKRRPATITGVTSSTVVNLRVGRQGEIYNNVPKRAIDKQTACWFVAGQSYNVTALVGEAVAAWKANQYSGTGALLDASGHGRDAAFGAGSLAPTFLPYLGEKYVYSPGVPGNYLSAPDSAALSIAGDITIDVKVALDTWTPAASQVFVGKYSNAATYSYLFYITATGILTFVETSDGTVATTKVHTASVVTGLANGAVKWLRASRTVNDGSGNYTTKFYTSPDGVIWTQLGTTQGPTAGAYTTFDSTAPLEIGSYLAGQSPISGKIYRVQIRNNTLDNGTGVVFDWQASGATEPYATQVESSINAATVTFNRPVSGKKLAVVDRTVLLFGTDDYLEVADHADLNFIANQDFTFVIVMRLYAAPHLSVPLAKRGNLAYGAAAEPGYCIRRDTAASIAVIDGGESGPVGALAPDVPAVFGLVGTWSGRRLGLGRIVRVTTSAGSTEVTTASVTANNLTNTNALRIGRLSGAGAQHCDFEFIGAAIIRRSLSNAEIVQLTSELLS